MNKPSFNLICTSHFDCIQTMDSKGVRRERGESRILKIAGNLVYYQDLH